MTSADDTPMIPPNIWPPVSKPVAAWLASTLFWSPLVMSSTAVATKSMVLVPSTPPHLEELFAASISGGMSLVGWLVTGWYAAREYDELSFLDKLLLYILFLPI